MTAKVITCGIQKGGVGKSTTSGILAYLMAKEGNKVLVVDMDSQGNVTDLITQKDLEFFEDRTILQAFENGSAEPFIYKAHENIDVLPSDDYLAYFPRWLYLDRKRKINLALDDLLEPLKQDYDYIVIDTPPSLGDQMTNAICASDQVIVMFESQKWAYTAIKRFIKTVLWAQEKVNPAINIAGILRVLNDARRTDSNAFIQAVDEKYGDLVFDTVIKRRANIGRMPLYGLFDNKEAPKAVKEYKKFYKELKQRMEVK